MTALAAVQADARELLDIFIEGGWAEAEDVPLLDRMHAGLLDVPDQPNPGDIPDGTDG